MRKTFLGLVAAGAFVAAAAPASAGCTTAYVCTWDRDRNAAPDMAYVGTGAASATVAASSSHEQIGVQAAGTSVQATGWYDDENGDGDPERIYFGSNAWSAVAGQRGGGYLTVYIVDRDRGDVIDYASATAAGGLGGVGVGGGVQYADHEMDFSPSTPFANAHASPLS